MLDALGKAPAIDSLESRPLSHRLTALAAVAAVVALQGCATTPPPPPPGEDLNLGMAKSCEFTPVTLALGGSGSSTITMSNDGWCAVRVTEPDGQPFALGLMSQRPEHGRVLIERIGGQTRLEYTPNPGYAGADRFTAALRPRETGVQDSRLQVAINVSRGAGVAPAAETTAPAATSSTSRSSTSSSSSTTTHRTRSPARRSTP